MTQLRSELDQIRHIKLQIIRNVCSVTRMAADEQFELRSRCTKRRF